MRPIKPSEVGAAKIRQLPPVIFEVVNNLIVKHWTGSRAVIKQNEITTALLNAMDGEPIPITRQHIYDNHWLDFEPAYEAEGWKVAYDRPGYNETYEASFEFTKK